MEYPLTHKQFYNGLKEGKLLGLKCRTCGALTTPPKMCCVECSGADLEVVELKSEGEIKTFTIIRVSPEGFPAPQIVALAEMADGPWLMGNIEGLDIEQATMNLIGKKVKLGCKIIPRLDYTSGEGVAITFSLL